MHVLLFCAALALTQTPDAGVETVPAPPPPDGLPRLAVTDLVAQGTKPEEAAGGMYAPPEKTSALVQGAVSGVT